MKSKRDLNDIIKEKRTPSSIKNLQVTANILLVTLFILAGLEYFITENEFKDIRENINLIDLSNRRIANLHIIVARIRDLMLINQGVYGPIDD